MGGGGPDCTEGPLNENTIYFKEYYVVGNTIFNTTQCNIIQHKNLTLIHHLLSGIRIFLCNFL
jgi:hypothetical protein